MEPGFVRTGTPIPMQELDTPCYGRFYTESEHARVPTNRSYSIHPGSEKMYQDVKEANIGGPIMKCRHQPPRSSHDLWKKEVWVGWQLWPLTSYNKLRPVLQFRPLSFSFAIQLEVWQF
ncbi:hypothetical protein Tco_1294653 [Tanacetum coccineum]